MNRVDDGIFAEFDVPGDVAGSARPRVTRHGTYIPKKTREYRALILAEWLKLGIGPFDGPLRVVISTYRKLPKSRPKKVASEPDTFKPDADNIAKNVLDALNGHAWRDDCQITSLSVIKCDRTRRQEEYIHVSISAKGR